MNICFVMFSGRWGGAETVIHELARHLCARGETVSVILNEPLVKHFSDLENVEIFNIGRLYPAKSIIAPLVKKGRRRNIVFRALSLPYPYLDEIVRHRYLRKAQKNVVEFLSGRSIDVISPILEDSVPFVSHLAVELGARNIAAVAIVAGEGNLRGTEPVHPLLRPITSWKSREFRKALTKMDKVVGPSAFMLSAWEAQGVSIRDKYVTIPNGVNLAELRDSLMTRSEPKGTFNLLFPGGSRFVKGGDLVIACLPAVRRSVPSIHLYIASDVPEDHRLRKMVRDLHLEDCVTFAGFLTRQEYRSLLHSADMLVMPSRDEAFGIVYLEAMALGKSIVAANKGGVPEVVKDGRNGLLVELEPHRVGEAILKLCQNEDLRKEMAKNNLEDAQRFNWSRIADQYIQLYRKVSKRRG